MSHNNTIGPSVPKMRAKASLRSLDNVLSVPTPNVAECITQKPANDSQNEGSTKRKNVTLTTKLAAAICVILEIPHEHQKLMTEDQVLSLVQWDHYPIPHAHGGPSAHWNLWPRTIMAHRLRTRTIDVPMIAKVKRLQRGPKLSRHKWGKRKMQSRPFRSAPMKHNR